MQQTSLPQLVAELLEQAREASSGRAATTLHGGHEQHLRQTVISLLAGRSLGEHNTPGEATLQVLTGSVTLVAGESSCHASAGDYLVIPPQRHNLTAVDDAAVLLSVATGM
jgi:quercetin dioxygenase-like cupin family protein